MSASTTTSRPRKTKVAAPQADAFAYFLIGAAFLLVAGLFFPVDTGFRYCDFKIIYYTSKTFLHHADPYSRAAVLATYRSDPQSNLFPPLLVQVVTTCLNLPTGLVLFAPIALIPWGPAHLIWTALTYLSFIGAAWLMLKVASTWQPRLSGLLMCVMVSGSAVLLQAGNMAGVVISLCIVAVYCLLHNRHTGAAALCMALALVLKPQDAGLVWLYFLLERGGRRRWALKTLALAAVLALASAIWVSSVSPHWISELSQNLALTSSHGQLNDSRGPNIDPVLWGSMLVSLQTVTGLFWSDPRVYSTVAFGILAPVLLVWIVGSLRARSDSTNVWFALAAAAPLSTLIGYHRQHDTRLLLLAVPACALLAARRDRFGKLAVALTTYGMLASSNLVLSNIGYVSFRLRPTGPGLGHVMLYALAGRPVPIAMLVMSVFYCVALMRETKRAGPNALPSYK